MGKKKRGGRRGERESSAPVPSSDLHLVSRPVDNCLHGRNGKKQAVLGRRGGKEEGGGKTSPAGFFLVLEPVDRPWEKGTRRGKEEKKRRESARALHPFLRSSPKKEGGEEKECKRRREKGGETQKGSEKNGEAFFHKGRTEGDSSLTTPHPPLSSPRERERVSWGKGKTELD